MGSLSESNDVVKVCANLMCQSVEEVINGMQQAKLEGADVVEVRLDYIKNFQPHLDLENIIKNKPLPIITVYRPKWNGGLYEGDEQARLETLHLAKNLGSDYIDIELKVASDTTSKQNWNLWSSSKLIVSCIMEDGGPSEEELDQLVSKMQATGADIIKLVTNAQDITEVMRLFSLLSTSKMPLIAYSLGERGLISQLLSPKFGGTFVYGSMEGNPVPGLPTLHSLRKVYGVKYINQHTTVFGLISKPVGHSKGPILHNPTFRHVKYNGVYVPMFVDDLSEFFKVYSSADYAGFSVGFPYKEAVLSFCDEVHPLAKSIGAVNTIIRKPSDGKLVGYNTDCEASITAIEDALYAQKCMDGEGSPGSPLAGKEFVVVGAGGAGRAIAFGARSRGARVVVFDIDLERARLLAGAVCGRAQHYEDITHFQPEKGAILANATPVGMHPNTDRIPVPEATLRDFCLVFDAVYIPRKTTLLKDAEAAGAVTVSGVEMFIRQAIGQFNLFTSGEAPSQFMRETVLANF